MVRERAQFELEDRDRAITRSRAWWRKEFARRNTGVQLAQTIGNIGNG